ncbi:MAG: ATP-dependent Clp protease adaptor ClpS [Pirellulales bacterium]|nr:ATP-dependent Clp protease adaptor ClpS [Pirellulales bacterium]
MGDLERSTAVETPVEPRQTPPRPKRQPQFGVMVDNDDDHTFPYVIEVFQKVFGYKTEKCVKLALTIHNQGRAVVWSGWKEIAELKVDQIKSAGKDFYAAAGPVAYPLSCRVVPMPG